EGKHHQGCKGLRNPRTVDEGCITGTTAVSTSPNANLFLGGYDCCCRMMSAWDLHKAWLEAEFKSAHIVTRVKHSLPQMYNIDGSNSTVVNRRPSGFKIVLCASPHTIAALDINNCTTQNTMDGVTVPSRHTEQQHFEQRRCNLARVDRNTRVEHLPSQAYDIYASRSTFITITKLLCGYKQFIDLFSPMTVQEQRYTHEEQEQTRNRWSLDSLLKVNPQNYQRPPYLKSIQQNNGSMNDDSVAKKVMQESAGPQCRDHAHGLFLITVIVPEQLSMMAQQQYHSHVSALKPIPSYKIATRYLMR
ncbi:hypothetical protein Tco_1033489, partial [Tanacetum coccineum]